MSFTDSQFTATQWDTAEAKAKLANQLIRFIEKDFDRRLWTKALYKRLSMMFGHIAEYDMHGFWATWFTTTVQQLRFLDNLVTHRIYGDPTWTWSDVERAVQQHVRSGGYRTRVYARLEQEIEASERATLARLQAKYGGA